jgi:hypothetical protein
MIATIGVRSFVAYGTGDDISLAIGPHYYFQTIADPILFIMSNKSHSLPNTSDSDAAVGPQRGCPPPSSGIALEII